MIFNKMVENTEKAFKYMRDLLFELAVLKQEFCALAARGLRNQCSSVVLVNHAPDAIRECAHSLTTRFYNLETLFFFN